MRLGGFHRHFPQSAFWRFAFQSQKFRTLCDSYSVVVFPPVLRQYKAVCCTDGRPGKVGKGSGARYSLHMSNAPTAPSCLPHFAEGRVIKGFGRGSKQLGIPTANFPQEVVDALPAGIQTGVYYGFAQVDGGQVHGMVMSVGWNPFYNNTHKSMETHVLHDFSADFYDSSMRVCMLGYIRPEKNFDSLQHLIDAIKGDIAFAEEKLAEEQFDHFRHDNFFSKKN